jgi:hypothetical protein
MNVQKRPDRVGERLKIFVGLAATAFAVTLALVIGNRLSDEALAVLAGAVCGVGAAIPTSLLVVAVTRRRDEARAPTMSAPHYQGSYPPVIVVAPPGVPQGASGWNTLPPPLSAPPLSAPQRHFTVVGGPPVENEAALHHR